MKILRRYILHELGLPFGLSFFTLNFIFMAGYLVKAANLIIGRGVPLGDTLYVLMLALPDMVSYTVPTSALTAVLIVFGNLSQNNEIRAVKASGVHPFQVMLPAFLVGLGLSFTMFVFNDQVATNTGFQLRRTTRQMLIKHPKAVIEPGRFVQLSDSLKFFAKEMKGNELRDIVAYEVEHPDKPIRTIIAERGEIISKSGNTQMQVRLYDGSVSDAQESGVQTIQFKTYEFPTVGQEDIRKLQKKMRELTLAELLMRLARRGETSGEERRELWTAFHQRIAFALGSFIFIFIGIPIAILVHRGEIILSFGIAMAAASLYYVLFAGAKTLAIQGMIWPQLSLWLPNVLLFGLGAYLLKRALVS